MKPIQWTLVAILAVIVALSAFAPGDTDPWKDAKFNYYWSPTDDTITDTENDTLTNTDILSGFYYYNYTINTTELADTVLVTVYVEECTQETGSQWYRADTMTSQTNQGLTRLSGGPIYGMRHRLVVDGTGANQDFKYDINATYKWDK